MLRRFSVNFAIFSMILDGASVVLGLWFSALVRPALSALSFVKDVTAFLGIPTQLYIMFPLIWIIIFSSLSIYDGRKFLRAADELAALFLSTFIASISTAGILYLSYRDVSRALFIVFVSSTFLLCLFWRAFARIYFHAHPQTSSTSRRLLVVGTGPLGQSVGQQIQASPSENLTLVGFVNDGYDNRDEVTALGEFGEIKALISKYQVTDVVIALPYSAYHRMTEITACLTDLPVGVWIALGFFDLALYRTDIEDFAGIGEHEDRGSALDAHPERQPLPPVDLRESQPE